jgi:ribonuclease P protein component
MARTGRLTSSADLRRTYAEGKRASASSVSAHVRATEEQRPARIGVTAVRGLGGAVQRNRAKRRVREAVRRVRPEIKDGADVIVVATPAALKASFQDMVDNLRSALSQAGGCR